MEKLKKILFLLLVPLINNAMAQNSKAKECYLKATENYNLGEIETALELVKKAIKKDPNFADPYSLLAAIHDDKKEYKEAENAYESFLKIDSMHALTYYYYASMLYKNEQPKKALQMLNTISRIPNMPGYDPKKNRISENLNNKINSLKNSIELDLKSKTSLEELEITNLGPSVNTSGYEYWPGMTLDKKILFFTRNRISDMQEDLYYCPIINDKYIGSNKLPGDINTPQNNEGTVAVNPNGDIIYYTLCNQADGYGSCDIYSSQTKGVDWSSKNNLGKTINSQSWDAQPTVSLGGYLLVFASSRPGGFGGKDLYMSYRNMNGEWTKPQNLGPTINTSADDEAPFLHYDGRTLYFSSTGHQGFGGQDIFMSRLNELDQWTTPVNIGKFINTPADESGFYVESTGKFAYFASDRPGGYGGLDIWRFKLQENLRPAPANVLFVKVIDANTNKEVNSKLVLTNLSNNRLILDTSAATIKTYYPSGGNFGLFAQASGYLPFSQNYNKPLKPNDAGITDTTVVRLVPSSKGNAVVLNNVFFDFDKYDLKPESNQALEQLYAYLKTNANIKIEIGGYTDNKGSDQYNKTLSDQRAAGVKSWLMQKGISANRLQSKGYGSLPTDDNSTEEKRALNRRIEVKIL